MVDYTFVDTSINLMDMVVDAEFETPLPSSKTRDILREILDALEIGTKLPILFEGLSKLQIAENRIEMSFRFSKKSDDIATLDEGERDELPRIRTLFVIHVFAKLDRVHRLGSVPFPADFRDLLEFTG